MKYLVITDSIPNGKYKVMSRLHWHERLRYKIAKHLLKSIPTIDELEINVTTGYSNKDRECHQNA